MPFFKPKKKETFNLKREIFRYAKNWKWFLLSIIILLIIAFFGNKTRPEIYETSARVKIINQKMNEIELPGNLTSLFEDSKVNLENEIEIFKSYRILEKVAKSLKLNVRYYNVTETRTTQVWDIPLKVWPISELNPLPTEGEYIINVDENGYSILDLNNKKWKVNSLSMDKAFKDLPFLITLDAIDNFKNLKNKKIKVRFFTIKEATLRLLNGLNIVQVGKDSEILKISLRNESSARSEAILNDVIEKFNEDGVGDRKLIFQRTIDFVDERFIDLTKELDSIENEKRSFKRINKLTDIEMDTERNLSDKSSSNLQKTNLETQLEIARIIRKTLTSNNNSELLPVNIGLGITGINDQIVLYNRKLLEINKLKISGGVNNPLIKNLNEEINNLKNNIFTSVVTYQKKSETALNNIKVIDGKNKGFFKELPNKEKILREIERDQTIKENLFIFLLQRKEEAAINLVITAPTLKVVDFAITNLIPVSESPRMVYAKAFIAGLVIPFVILYLMFFVDTKIQSKEDLYANITASYVIGDIALSSDRKIFSSKSDNSDFAESFRMLRTNIGYVFKTFPEKNSPKIIMITSSREEEGKTFCAINLALSYSILNKKVLLLDTNFRNPEIPNSLKLTNNNNTGLSDYLLKKVSNFKGLVSYYKIDNKVLDVI
ncbi:MAG: Wzz/FepE/Etk N-terminal domain-containing protein, partial [Polaribacter sp.]|nr:Wzz/FepE/Etk N-terminal domain-containing protein [Polaribacter sp.]